MNYSFTFMLGVHGADTWLHCAPQRFHSLSVVRLRCPGFMSILRIKNLGDCIWQPRLYN